MSNPWGAPSSYLQDTGALASIYTKIDAIEQSRESTISAQPFQMSEPGVYELPS